MPVGQLSGWRAEAHQILERRKLLETLDVEEFRQQVRALRWRIRAEGPHRRYLQQVYAYGVEAARRTLGMVHFPVQIMGGISLYEGKIAEMHTGEGKTLTATLPMAFRAMAGRGAHLVTSNDYLAARDAETMRPLYALLGLSVGCIQQSMSDDERRSAYACDITYGTASELGFDFLRDRLKLGANAEDFKSRMLFSGGDSGESPVQRGQYFALVDEADCILIDEARTPLIIGVMQKDREAMLSLYRWCASVTSRLQHQHDFIYDQRHRRVDLTDQGCQRVNLLAKPLLIDSIDTETIYQHVENALTSQWAFQRDKDYVIHDDEIVIVDEGTGRKMDGRKWQAGLHQAIEAKERIEITDLTKSAARITIQSLFRYYEHLAGMTGTALPARHEFRRVYNRSVCRIPTNRPCLRKSLPVRCFATAAAKHAAIIIEVQRLVSRQRAVLIGTPSVEASEALAARLTRAGVAHTVLNARFLEQEAEIVAQAGQQSRVTIATNMAGRGTDILLDDIVRQQGGLHVIATELHSSKRIDRQLVGRSARQGDPGSFQFFLSLEDELLHAVNPQRRTALLRTAHPDAQGELTVGWSRVFVRIQQSLEKLHARQRKMLLKAEREQQKKFRRIGLDPFLEIAEE